MIGRMPRAALVVTCVSIQLLTALQAKAAVTVATVGDSLADAIYLGLKLQPDVLRKNGINLVRWSRPKIGLTRIDYFDYAGWLRDTKEIGNADFCVVEMGANDLQSISTGDQKWLRVGTDAWQHAYADRVLALVKLLKARRCGTVVWLLQPAYQKNRFLGQYHDMMKSVQMAGTAAGAVAFEIDAGNDDYSPDGVHPNKQFCFKLGKAVANLVAEWGSSSGSNCASCHASPEPVLNAARLADVAPLIPQRTE